MSAAAKIQDPLDELADAVERLRQALASERDAVACLDIDRLKVVEHEKEQAAAAVAAFAPAATTGGDPTGTRHLEVAAAVRRVRADAQANAMLLAAAVESIHAVLGIREDLGYDRRARRAQTTTGRLRILTAL